MAAAQGIHASPPVPRVAAATVSHSDGNESLLVIVGTTTLIWSSWTPVKGGYRSVDQR